MVFPVRVLPVEEDGGDTVAPTKPEIAAGSSVVAYDLASLPMMLGGPVLVAGYGNAMRAVVKACDKAMKGRVFVTGTEDKRRGFSCSDRAQVVSLAPEFDKRLFANAHAIVQAAISCGAKAILLADRDYSDSEPLRMAAAYGGVLLLAAAREDKSLSYWVGLEPASGAPERALDWRRCPHCKMFHEATLVMAAYGQCPTCGKLYRLTSDERIAMTFDEGSFVEWDADVEEANPLDFPGFDNYIERARMGGHAESVRTGSARIGGNKVATGIMESDFMMGSLGYVAGERIARMVERATDERLPVVIFTASGGARMQEGLVSLMQMAKVSVALERHGRAGLAFFSVITDPTTGGVTASFALQGDVVIAEPGALIGFAGQRVIQDTIRQKLPEGFQTAEFALEHGLVDAIVPRRDLRGYLARLIALHVSGKMEGTQAPVEEPPCADESERSGGMGLFPLMMCGKQGAGLADFVEQARGSSHRAMRRAAARHATVDAPGGREMAVVKRKGVGNAAWDSVVMARNVKRPTARCYIDEMVEGFMELHGDRAFGDDGAIVGGLGWIDGRAVTVIAEEKGADLKDRIERNFGCPQPEGYRKSRRLMQQAQKFGRPIVCLVDTQGAFCGMEAEERGQGNAIAENLMELAGLTVPVVSVIVGEGGSGGALALALANRVAMQENAVYSVLSPEGFASILWKDRARAPEAAAVMKMSAQEACDMGIVEEVLGEGPGPAHENPETAAMEVADFVRRALDELDSMTGEELRDQRFARFRGF